MTLNIQYSGDRTAKWINYSQKPLHACDPCQAAYAKWTTHALALQLQSFVIDVGNMPANGVYNMNRKNPITSTVLKIVYIAKLLFIFQKLLARRLKVFLKNSE